MLTGMIQPGQVERRTHDDVPHGTFEQIAVLPEPQATEQSEARYHIFLVTAWAGGEPSLQGPEHSELRWLSLDQALSLPLAHPAYGQLFRAALSHGNVLRRDI